MTTEIWGVVLAAGRSRRMGRPKALLQVAGESFLARAVRVLRAGGCAEVVVVVGVGGADDPAITAEAHRAGARTLANPAAAREQIDSLRTALRAIPESVAAVVVSPVDFPRVTPEVVTTLIDVFRRDHPPIVVPAFDGERGHPTLFARKVFPELMAEPLAEGARSVVRANASTLREVAIDDAAVLDDVNTPEDVRRVLPALEPRP